MRFNEFALDYFLKERNQPLLGCNDSFGLHWDAAVDEWHAQQGAESIDPELAELLANDSLGG